MGGRRRKRGPTIWVLAFFAHVCVWFWCVHMNSRLICVCVFSDACVGWGKGRYCFSLTRKKGGSEVEPTGTLHHPDIGVCLLARGPQLGPRAALDGDKDASMWPGWTFSHLPPGGQRHNQKADQYEPSGRKESDRTDLPLRYQYSYVLCLLYRQTDFCFQVVIKRDPLVGLKIKYHQEPHLKDGRRSEETLHFFSHSYITTLWNLSQILGTDFLFTLLLWILRKAQQE